MTSCINALGYTGKTTLVLTGIYGCIGAGTTFLFLFSGPPSKPKKTLDYSNRASGGYTGRPGSPHRRIIPGAGW